MTTRPDGLDADSNGVVPVLLDDAGEFDPDEVVVDSLRYGSPEAVRSGDGAAPVRAQRLGHDGLQIHFRAADAGFECSDRPVGAMLAGRLEDGTPISRLDVVPEVTCRKR